MGYGAATLLTNLKMIFTSRIYKEVYVKLKRNQYGWNAFSTNLMVKVSASVKLVLVRLGKVE